MTFLWETPYVILEGLAWLLSGALWVLGIARAHIGTLKIAGKNIPHALPTIDGVSWEMIKAGSCGFSQIDREELDDE
jgi:hypothetical protein